MNDDPKRNKDQHESDKYLRKIDDTYVFDEASGLYKPKSHLKNDRIEHTRNIKISDQPLRVLTRTIVATDWVVFVLSCSGLLLSGLTIVLLFMTVHYARNQWREANRSADAAEKSAIASKEASDTARDALVEVQRAFIVPSIPIKNNIGGLVVQVQWDNTGTTPTKNLLFHSNWEYGKTYPPDLYTDKWDPRSLHRATHSFMGPRAIVYAPAIDISSSQALGLAQSNTHLYLWGWAKYDDIFKGTPNHITRYCYEIILRPEYDSAGAVKSALGDTQDCPRWNCHDEECNLK